MSLIARLRELSVFRLSLIIGALVVIPRLGSVGLWDPWETHYAEVGRQMLARGDLVHPYWQNTRRSIVSDGSHGGAHCSCCSPQGPGTR